MSLNYFDASSNELKPVAGGMSATDKAQLDANTENLSSLNEINLATESPTEDGKIRFGVDADGNYGYFKVGADSVTPFKTGSKCPMVGYFSGTSKAWFSPTLLDSDYASISGNLLVLKKIGTYTLGTYSYSCYLNSWVNGAVSSTFTGKNTITTTKENTTLGVSNADSSVSAGAFVSVWLNES